MTGAGPGVPGDPGDPGDPFRNPGWGGQDAYPATPPSAPPPWAASPGTPLPPPAPKKGVWPVVLAVVAGFSVMLGVLGFLAASGGDDDAETVASERDDEDDDDTTTTPSSTTTSTSTSTTTTSTTSTTTTAPAPDVSDLPSIGGPVVASGDWSIQLPDGWAGADIADGVEGVGAQLFPGDPTLAAQVDASLQAVPRLVRIFGMDTAGAQAGNPFASNLNVLADPVATSGAPMQQLLDFQRRSLESLGIATVGSSAVVDLGGRPVGRLLVQLDGVPARTLAYIVDSGTEVVVITYTVADDGSLPDGVFDASVATFSAG